MSNVEERLIDLKFKVEKALANNYVMIYTGNKDTELKTKTQNALKVLADWKSYTPSYVLYSIRYLVTQRKLDANRLGIKVPIKHEVYKLNRRIKEYQKRLYYLPQDDMEREVIEINLRKWNNQLDWYNYILDYIEMGEVVVYRLA